MRTKERAPAPPVPTGHFQYGLSSLLLILTLVAILCSIAKMHLGLGIVVAILTVPALLRTIIVASRRGQRGEPMSIGGKAVSVLLTLAAVIAVSVLVLGAFIAAFLATCAATTQSRDANALASLIASLAAGSFAGIATAGLCGFAIWNLLRRGQGR
jgi:hypothetical protein